MLGFLAVLHSDGEDELGVVWKDGESRMYMKSRLESRCDSSSSSFFLPGRWVD